MRRRTMALAATAALLIAGCGQEPAPEGNETPSAAAPMLDDSRIAGLLSAEAKAALGILEQGVRTELAAYKAQYGKLPDSFAELASLETARAASVAAITDAMAEQVPFVSRSTLEQMASQFVGRAQQRLFDQWKAAEASAVAPPQE